MSAKTIDWVVLFNNDAGDGSKDFTSYVISALTQEGAAIRAIEEYENDGFEFDGFVRVAAAVSKPIKVTRAWKMEEV